MAAKIKVPGLDIVRFMTAGLVVMFHLCYWRNGNIAPESDFLDAMWKFGWVGVEIFFTISGYVIAFSAENSTPREFALSRVVRLVPTIWICATLTLIAMLSLSKEVQPGLFHRYLSTIFLKPTGDHIDVVYWTLTVEIAFYALVFVLIRIRDFDFLLKAVMCIGLLSAAFDLSLLATQLSSTVLKHSAQLVALAGKHTSRLLLLRHGCFFAIGAVLWSHRTAHKPKHFPFIFLALLVATTAEVSYTATDHALQFPSEHSMIMTAPIAWLIGLLFIYLGSFPSTTRMLQANRVSRALRLLGLLTFPLYLLHNNFGLLVRQHFQHLWTSNSGTTFLTITTCLTLSYLVCAYIEPRVAYSVRELLERIAHALDESRLTSKMWNMVTVRQPRG